MLNRITTLAALVVICWFSVARGATIPNIAQGTVVQVREGDTWSQATYLRKEGRKALIRYSDGSTEWVTPDRVRLIPGTAVLPDDAGATDSDSPASAAPGSDTSAPDTTDSPAANSSAPPAPAPLRNSEIVIDADNPPTSQENDDPNISKPLPAHVGDFVHIGFGSEGFHGFGQPILKCLGDPSIYFTVAGRHDFHPDADTTTLQRIDISNRSAGRYHTLNVKAENVRGIGAGGKFITTVTRSGDVSALQLWSIDSGTCTLRATIKMTCSDGKFDYGKAWPITADRLVIDRQREGLYLVNLATAKVEAFCKHDWGDTQMTPDGRFLVVHRDDGFLFVRPDNLNIVAVVPGGDVFGHFSVDPTCTLLAYPSHDRLHIVKIATGDEVGKIILGQGMGECYLLSSDYVAVDHNGSLVVYDVKSGYPFWSYKRQHISQYCLASDGRFLFEFDSAQFALVTLPDPKAVASLKNLSHDQYILSPGTSIAVKGDAGAFNASDDDVKKAVKSSLEDSGHTLADGASPYELNWTAAPGPTENKSYYHTNTPFPTPFVHFGTGTPINVSCASTIVTVNLTFQGQTIWTTKLTFTAPDFINLGDGTQTVQQIADADSRPNVDRLHNLGIPPYLLKGATSDNSIAPMETEITPAGITSEGNAAGNSPKAKAQQL